MFYDTTSRVRRASPSPSGLPIHLILDADILREAAEHTDGRREGRPAPPGMDATYWQWDFRGLAAELAVQAWLRSLGVEFEAAPLVAESGYSRPDISIRRWSFDVKAICGRQLCINKRAHENPKKRPNFYWGCRFVRPDTILLLRPIPSAHVSEGCGWTLVNNVARPFYCIEWKQLKPLCAGELEFFLQNGKIA